ncbi:unnamed protein product [Spirodela intermedia]|uniref:DNA 3'-5' helicase n=1 Tax=Spirodela intermedia TaxID=51605 RepID=A0A7I8KFR2_SPIIN|nr:unnamed protein product [Spirodela intermedia]
MKSDSDSDGSHVSATPPRGSPPPPPPPRRAPRPLSAAPPGEQRRPPSAVSAPVKRKSVSKVGAPSKCKKYEKPRERSKSAIHDLSDSFLSSPDCSRLPFAPVKIPNWNNPAASLSSSVISRKPSFDPARFEQVEINGGNCLDPVKLGKDGITGGNSCANDLVDEVSLGLFRCHGPETSVRDRKTNNSQIDKDLFTSTGISPTVAACPEKGNSEDEIIGAGRAVSHRIDEGSREVHHELSPIRSGARVAKAHPNWISGPSGMTMTETPKRFKFSNEGNFVKLNLNTYGRKKFRYRNGKRKFAVSRFSRSRRKAPDVKPGGVAEAGSYRSEMDSFDSDTLLRQEGSVKCSGGIVEEAILAVREDQSDENLQKLLKLTHGYDSFREGQLTAVKQILEGKSTMLVLPTGAGKSLCYQLPALILPGLTLVISPLVSLMVDQIRQLPPLISGGLLCSNQTIEEVNETLDQILHGRLKVLFVSPERFTDSKFLGIFEDGPAISLIVVDEAHCLSEWSHNFRPSYLRLRSSLFKTKLSVDCVLAMTATSTTQTLDDIMRSLDIKPCNLIQTCNMRENLELHVTMSGNRLKDLLALLKSSPLNEVRSIIVYCKFQSETDLVGSYLCDNGIPARSYHSGIRAKNRSRTQELFCANKIRVVVATVAFGMGLDKRDVGAVIHYSLPESLEEYVQETGRAGRDGRLSLCHLLLDDNTYYKLRSLLYSDGTDEYAMNRLLCQIFDYKINSPGNICSLVKEFAARTFDMKEEVILTVLTQLELGEVQYIRLLPPTNVTCTLQFHKSSPSLLSGKSIVVAAILKKSEAKQGHYIFDIPTVANSTRITAIELLNHLQKLKSSGEITYETKDPAFYYAIMKRPEDIVSLSTDLTKWLCLVEICKIRKLDAMFGAAMFAAKECKRTGGCSSSLHSECMRKRILDYFARGGGLSQDPPLTMETKSSPFLRADIKVFLQSNPHVKFTPRAVARIMHGIPSPAFPYATWSNTHFWGRHSQVDFPAVMRAAAVELISMPGRGGAV